MDVFSRIAESAAPYFRAAALRAAEELGVLAALAPPHAEPLDAGTLAARLGVAPRRLRALLDVLVLEGALVRRDGLGGPRYAPGRTPAALPPIPDEGWGRLAEVIRSDRPLAPPADEPAALGRFHRHLESVGADAARALVERLSAAHRPPRRVLDAGGGTGAYAAACLEAWPEARVTLVDRPAVVALAGASLARFGDRVRLVGADLEEAALDAEHDLALLANLLHLHPPEVSARLVACAARALRPGGLLVVKDLAIASDRSGPPAGVLFALNMALYTEGGDVHPPAEIAAWLARAGLIDVGGETLAGFPDAAIVTGRCG